jgi:hypothetical protein
MIALKLDEARNVLHVTYSKRVSPTQIRQAWPELEMLLAKIEPGFQILTDLSGLEEMEFTCAPEIKRMMDLCRKKGVANVVRIIPDPKKDIGFKLMSFFHYRRGVAIVTCETMAEALQALSS